MDSEQTSTFTLKVNINCCENCPRKASKKLQKMDGVDSVKFDTENRLVRVIGSIDPMVIINKFKQWGKKAVLHKDPPSHSAGQSPRPEPDKCSTCRQGGGDDDDIIASSGTSDQSRSGKALTTTRWHFPRTAAPEHYSSNQPPRGPVMPFGSSQLSERPFFMGQTHTMMYPRPTHPFHDYGLSAPLVARPPPPQTSLPHRTRRRPNKNAMIHHTNNQDNYNHYP